jgi:hypothetical protein
MLAMRTAAILKPKNNRLNRAVLTRELDYIGVYSLINIAKNFRGK